MDKIKSTEAGFGFWPSLVGLAVISIIIAVAFVVKHPAASSSPTSNQQTEAQAEAAQYPKDAVGLVTTVYRLAINLHQPYSQTELNQVKPYLTTTLYDHLRQQVSSGLNHDLLFCQGETPKDFSITVGAKSKGFTTLLVNETFPDNTPIEHVTVNVQSSPLKITSITCPTGQVYGAG